MADGTVYRRPFRVETAGDRPCIVPTHTITITSTHTITTTPAFHAVLYRPAHQRPARNPRLTVHESGPSMQINGADSSRQPPTAALSSRRQLAPHLSILATFEMTSMSAVNSASTPEICPVAPEPTSRARVASTLARFLSTPVSWYRAWPVCSETRLLSSF